MKKDLINVTTNKTLCTHCGSNILYSVKISDVELKLCSKCLLNSLVELNNTPLYHVLDDLKSKLFEYENTTLLEEIERLESENSCLTSEIDDLESEKDDIESENDELHCSIDDLTTELEKLNNNTIKKLTFNDFERVGETYVYEHNLSKKSDSVKYTISLLNYESGKWTYSIYGVAGSVTSLNQGIAFANVDYAIKAINNSLFELYTALTVC